MQELIRRAMEVRKNAYAPYSGYSVGAAIEDADGEIWTGVNVENVSYGGTICAERAALVQMVSAGSREISRLVVATRDGAPPCGLCLQVLREFAPDPHSVEVHLVAETGEVVTRPLSEFLPFGFSSASVRRT
jgi:cytidine deaminase